MWDAKQLTFDLNIDNPKKRTIDDIEVQFIQNCAVRGVNYRKTIGDFKLRATSNWSTKNYNRILSIPLGSIRSAMPPTCSYSIKGGDCNTVIVSYVLTVKVCMSGFCNDIQLKIPVFVCNKQ